MANEEKEMDRTKESKYIESEIEESVDPLEEIKNEDDLESLSDDSTLRDVNS